MNKDFQKLIDKLVQSLDWDSIYTIHKAFKFGVGEGSEVIPGLKRKVFSEILSKNDVKNELKTLLKFVIENDLNKMVYGQWMIFWINQEWDLLDEEEMRQEMGEDEDIEIEFVTAESRLEVIYAPQRICLTVDINSGQVPTATKSDYSALQSMLDKALAKEDYELAQKLQEILKLTNNTEQ
jgi:hypothetical protein